MSLFYRTLVLLSVWMQTVFQLYAQADQPKPTTYSDFVIDGNQVWLLNSKGFVMVGNLYSENYVDSTLATDAPIIALTKDRKRNIVIGDSSHTIRQYDNQQKVWLTIGRTTNKLTNIIFNSHNTCFGVTNLGIVDIETGKCYFPADSLSGNSYVRYKNSWFHAPTCFIDHQDKLWLGFDHGEWGGDVFAFDTRKKTFIPLKTAAVNMAMNPVDGFCEAEGHVYMSGGLSHISLTHGSIVKFTDNVAYSILESKDVETPVKVGSDKLTGKVEKWITWTGGHQIGPITYNARNNCLYFYSQNGIFKGRLKARLGDINQWKNVLKPQLKWGSGRHNTVGSPMNVLKMEFTPNGALVFLAEYDGLGIYDGKSLHFIR